MKFRRRSLALIAGSLVAVLAMAGCASGTSTSSPSGSSSAAVGDTLTVQSQATPVSLDNISGTPNALLIYWQPTYDSLLFQKPDGKIVANLATSWKYNADQTQMTLKLRDDVKFTDGTPFDAEAVKTNLDRLHSGNGPESGTVAAIDNVKVVNQDTVLVTLTQPDPGIERAFTNVAGMMASPKAIAGGKLASDPVGSGPYIFNQSETITGSSYVFDRNPHYWNPGLQHYKKIVISVLSDPSATLNALISGQVNAALVQTKQRQAAVGAGLTPVNLPPLNSIFMMFDRGGVIQPELADVRVRQAINYAFDRNAFVKQIYGGKAELSGQVFPPGSSAFVPALDKAYPYNPKKARALLAAAGYASGFTLTMPANPVLDPTINSVIEQNLNDVGIKVKWLSINPSELLSGISKQSYAAVWSVTAQRGTWEDYLRMIAPSGLYNPFHTTDPKVQALAKIVQTDPAKAGQAAQDLNKYISDQAWFAPFARYQQDFYVDKKTSVLPTVFRAVPDIYSYMPR